MLYLEFIKNNQKLFRYPFTSDSLLIGRSEDCDIVLADNDISRNHLKITRISKGLKINNLSEFGTFLNAKSVQKEICTEQDILNIGKWKISFAETFEKEKETTLQTEPESTKILEYNIDNKKLTKESFQIRITKPNRETYYKKLNRNKISIGNTTSNDIVIDDSYVSKHHCKIVKEHDQIWLIDLGSTNGTYIDGEKIEKIELENNTSFMIGKTEIALQRLRETEKIKQSNKYELDGMLSASSSMRQIFSLITKVATTNATIFITGESGTGKELVAKSIHNNSNRKAYPFVAINCGAIPETLIESELFGHEKGAFTGAGATYKGVFEQANLGTLFLDEIGEMPLELQTRLLRALETRTIRRIGGNTEIQVNVRIIAATNKKLKEIVRNGNFREDLFYRLFIVPIELPPLCNRENDIMTLAKHFTKMFSIDGTEVRFSRQAIAKLQEYHWPGNIRELKNTIQRAVILKKEKSIRSNDLLLSKLTQQTKTISPSLITSEKQNIIHALRNYKGNQTKASDYLGISRTTIASKIRKYNIDVFSLKYE